MWANWESVENHIHNNHEDHNDLFHLVPMTRLKVTSKRRSGLSQLNSLANRYRCNLILLLHVHVTILSPYAGVSSFVKTVMFKLI